MSQNKIDIMRRALESIELGYNGNAKDLAIIANKALRAVAACVDYSITARTWYGKNGGEFIAELREVATGNIVFSVSGSTWGSDAWSYAMRDKMHARMPEVFPDPQGGHPTIYFREVCRVEYEHAEVSRKRDL